MPDVLGDVVADVLGGVVPNALGGGVIGVVPWVANMTRHLLVHATLKPQITCPRLLSIGDIISMTPWK